jgi:endonuclease YncB( thermonuclease family)
MFSMEGALCAEMRGRVISCLSTALLFAALLAHAASPRTLTATVERVSDGDTVVAIAANQTKLRIRPPGTDAVEDF